MSTRAPARRVEIGATVVEQLRRTLDSVVRLEDLRTSFAAHRRQWRLPGSMRFGAFLELLLRDTGFIEVRLDSSAYASMVRFSYGEPNSYALGCALREGAFLSHGSALELHGLGMPGDTVYVNKEQSAKPRPEGTLTQEALTRAFANKARVSQYVLTWKQYSFVLLNGKDTGRLEVIPFQLPDGGTVEVTGLERTLVDAAVRPAYCGGVENVARAYHAAKERVDTSRLLRVLAELDHVYPYHQAIGFYMDRAGFEEAALEKVRALGLRFEFFLAHGLRRPKFSPEWKVYYPRDLCFAMIDCPLARNASSRIGP